MIKIRPENIIYFVTVCGFFIGLMFCVVSMDEPTDILLYTLEITLFFYLLSHIAVMNFIDTKDAGKNIFDREQYEDISSYFVHEIEDRESRMGTLLKRVEKVQPQVIKRKKRHDGSHKKKAA